MGRRLILDTSLLVRAERGLAPLAGALEADDDVAIAAITVAEMCTGIELADDEARRHARASFVDRVLETIPVEPYDTITAGEHGRLLAHVHRSGTPRGSHDLIIAATGVATGRAVITADRRARFGDLPGVESLQVD